MMTFVIILLILISIAALISAAYYETPYLKPLVDKWLNKGHGSKVEPPLCDLRQHPHMKLNIIISESGFANETSFYRTFKTICGMTPAEWRAKKH